MQEHNDCTLYQQNGITIPGEGASPCDIMFVGEAGGEREAIERRPFVGRSGKLLTNLIEKGVGVSREDVFISNLVHHRPPSNRNPSKAEIQSCLPYLLEEIRRCNPRIIVTLGRISGQAFVPKLPPLVGEHGKARLIHCEEADWQGVVVPWYHPAFILRRQDLMPLAINDAKGLLTEVDNLALKNPPNDYQLVQSAVPANRLFAFDLETTSPTRGSKNVFMSDEAQIVGYSVSSQAHRAGYVARYTIAPDLVKYLESSDYTKIIQNSKFERKVLKNAGIILDENVEDTMILGYLLGESSVGLKEMTRQHLGVIPETIEDVWGAKSKMYNAPREVALETYRTAYKYGAADADHTLRLYQLLLLRLESEGLVSVYRDIELPLVPVLADMEATGVLVDYRTASTVLEELSSAEEEARLSAQQSLGGNTAIDNIGSHQQLSTRLEQLGAPITKRTNIKESLVVDDVTLQGIREWNPALIDSILEFRKYQKLKSFVSNFLALRGLDGRLHSSFNQAGSWEEDGKSVRNAPASGRLSSSGPNLQQVPHHSDELWGSRIRGCIVPSPGRVLLACDLEQEEPRIVSHIAQDSTLLTAFAAGKDIYRPATEALYPATIRLDLSDTEWKGLFDHERYNGKTFFLAWYYGGGAGTLRDIDVRLSSSVAGAAIHRLRAAHPAREIYLTETTRQVEQHGFVETLFGRKRWIAKVYSPDRKVREEGLREIANHRVQGSAADILKIAMRRIWDGLQDMESKLIMVIHDEVVLDAVPDEVDRLKELVYTSFQGLIPVELPVSFQTGLNWGSMS